jgi:hypothetical protein
VLKKNNKLEYFSLKYDNNYILIKKVYPSKDIKENRYHIICFHTDNNEKTICQKVQFKDKSKKTLETKPSIVNIIGLLKQYLYTELSENDCLIYYSNNKENYFTIACDFNNFKQAKSNEAIMMIYKKQYN